MRPNKAFASCIDLIGLPVSWSASLISCDIIPYPFSDPCAVLLSTKVPDVLEHGPGLWKLNCSVLSEDEYINIISSFWSHWCSRRESYPSVADWWERGKSRLKGLTITYCKNRASRRRARRATLVRLVDHWKHQVDNGVVSCLDPYQSPLAELEHVDHVEAEGARVRVLVQWIEDGKASTAFFFRRDRKQSADRWIPALRGAENVVCTDVDGIGAVLITSKNNSA